MHELSVCQALIRQVQDIAREHRAVAVTSVKVQIGPLSGVEVDFLRQAFPLAPAGSVAEAAQLVIKKLSIRVRGPDLASGGSARWGALARGDGPDRRPAPCRASPSLSRRVISRNSGVISRDEQ